MVKKIDTLKRLRLLGDFLMLGTFLMLLWLFVSAYLSNDFSARININHYGEAHVEMILLLFFLLPISIITVALSFMDWRQTWKARQKIITQKYLTMDAPSSYPPPPEKTLVCPRCQARFEASLAYSNGMITCPGCGLTGTYDQSKVQPTVRIIKGIS